jgi:hypothetical protein
MKSPNEIKDLMIKAVKDSFGNYLERGFSLRNAVVEPTFVELVVVGARVALVFQYDIRDEVLDCAVAQVSNNIVAKRGHGYFIPITAYLRAKSLPSRNPLSHIPRPLSTEERIKHDIKIYAALVAQDTAIIEGKLEMNPRGNQ